MASNEDAIKALNGHVKSGNVSFLYSLKEPKYNIAVFINELDSWELVSRQIKQTYKLADKFLQNKG